ncbi:MAG: hypothetical protein IPI67_08195 [Myxococcales bacterium]|nr:hypothetical protein [Myxococcales bacterium]
MSVRARFGLVVMIRGGSAMVLVLAGKGAAAFLGGAVVFRRARFRSGRGRRLCPGAAGYMLVRAICLSV